MSGLNHKKTDTGLPGAVTKDDWNDDHKVTGDVDFSAHKAIGLADPTNAQDAATKAYVDAHAGGGSGTITGVTAGSGLTGGGTTGGVSLALANTAVTPGVYTNLNATIGADGRIIAAANGSGGGGGGITNSALAGVVMLSNGTNAVASGITDDGTAVTLAARQLGIGGAPAFAYRKVQITGSLATDEEMLWIEDNATGHVGTGGQNQAINLVLRQQGTSNTTAGAATATGADIAVTQTVSTGGNPLINTAVLANASGGTTNYSWYSSNGLMVQTGDASFGNFAASGNCSVSGTGAVGGTLTVGGILTASSTVTLGPSATTGKVHTINGNIALRSPDADTYLNIKNNSTGGRDYFIEASGNGGTDPNCIAIYDNTAGATRFKIDSAGVCYVMKGIKLPTALFTENAGSPEGVVTAIGGSYCADTTNGEGYIKKTVALGNTGWKLITHA